MNAPKTDRKVTTEKQRAAIARIASRFGLIAAAKRSGRPYATCYTICARLGVQPKREGIDYSGLRARALAMRAKGMSYYAIARKLRLTAPCVRNWCLVADIPTPAAKPRKVWPLLKAAQRLRRKEALSTPQIAARLGVARSTAWRHLLAA